MNGRRIKCGKLDFKKRYFFIVFINSLIILCLVPGISFAAGSYLSVLKNPFENSYTKDPYSIDDIADRSFHNTLDLDCSDLISGWVSYDINDRKYSDMISFYCTMPSGPGKAVSIR